MKHLSRNILLATTTFALTLCCTACGSTEPSATEPAAVEEQSSEQSTTEAPSSETTTTEQTATETTENTYTGTCRIVTGQELLELQAFEGDLSVFDSEADTRFAIVLLDPPQAVNARFAGDPDAMQESVVDMICLGVDGIYSEGDVNSWAAYDGKNVTVQIDPMDTMYPSDVRLPLGRPHIGSAILVSAQ